MNEYDNPYLREENTRGHNSINVLRNTWIYVCGIGALGSNLVENLIRQGAMKVIPIDYDRVSRHNVSTSIYGLQDEGRLKTDALVRHIGMNLDVWLEAKNKRLDPGNTAKTLRRADLVIDALDNSESRSLVAKFCESKKIPCLHVGMSADGLYGECVWNEDYKIPDDVDGDPCDVAAARNLILLTVAVASELIVQRITDKNTYKNASITLKDLTIH